MKIKSAIIFLLLAGIALYFAQNFSEIIRFFDGFWNFIEDADWAKIKISGF